MATTEIQILDWIQSVFQSDFADTLMPVITSLGDAGIVWLILATVLLINPKTRKVSIVLWLSLLVELILCNIMIKPLVARTRPYIVNPTVQLLIEAPHDYSFPSGHTGASFASAFGLLFYKNKGWIPCMILAVLIAFSRLYLYVHFPTDVLGGIVFGLISGYIGAKYGGKIYEYISNKFRLKKTV